jgi:hypothetical protein
MNIRQKIVDHLIGILIGKIADTVWPWLCQSYWHWLYLGLALGIVALVALRGPVEELPVFLLNRRTQLKNLTAYRRRASDNATPLPA